jgi:hypothetical protein
MRSRLRNIRTAAAVPVSRDADRLWMNPPAEWGKMGKAAWFMAVFIVACSVQPPRSDIESAIRRYYDAQGHRVIDVVIGDISSQPVSDMKYMGTKGYSVSVERLTLEIGKEITGSKPYTPGERVVFEKGFIAIREDPAEKGRWLIVSVSSNLAP